ncbi:MAG: CidA/LrgA family protein [Lachnospiraceae bacterium]|nr:CidA/LrgA family protein [Lachnospiraceae bacterium]
MLFLLQLLFVFFICKLGEFISSLLPFTFPSTVISMFLLLILLLTGIVKEKQVDKSCDFLLKHMAFFFVPSGVAIIEKYDLLKGNIGILLFICLLTTIITFAATAFTVTAVMKLQDKRRKK